MKRGGVCLGDRRLGQRLQKLLEVAWRGKTRVLLLETNLSSCDWWSKMTDSGNRLSLISPVGREVFWRWRDVDKASADITFILLKPTGTINPLYLKTEDVNRHFQPFLNFSKTLPQRLSHWVEYPFRAGTASSGPGFVPKNMGESSSGRGKTINH